ncbi:VgrG protein [Minicystis rosea]|nr:VgrG protein [Minicystis rosea]
MHTFRVHGLDHDLHLIRFDGHEGISELFSFDVTLACEDRDIAFSAVVGAKATLEIRSGDSMRRIHGIVSDFEQGDEGKKLTAYRTTLVPAVWRLRHVRASRIFQGDTTPQIIEKVLLKAGIAASGFRFALRGEYKPREYCVQYRETDFAFLSRLMEEDGMAYFFEHGGDEDVFVVSDNGPAHVAVAGGHEIAFRAPTGALQQGEHVSRFRWSERVRPGKVTLRDYNFKKPTLPLERAADARGALEVYDYPGDYEDPGEGARLAAVRLEELRAPQRTGEGDSVCARLASGLTFTMTDHPRDDFNRRYLVTRIEHHGVDPHVEGHDGADRVYENHFDVIPAEVAFRPAQITPKPTIRGVQTAFVVGPKGEEIYTDEHGRVKVKFHWDREGKGDETSSCWIRVSQAWAGSAWGAMVLPRVGHEVVIDFVEGDPDRPLVVGSVYHGTNVPPYPLPAERTKSTLKSQSVGGSGSNEIRFEDKKGSEEVFVHAQKDMNIAVEHDESRQIGHNRAKSVTADDSETIGGNKTIMVAQNQMETIGANDSLTVGGNLLVTVAGAIAIASGGGGGGGGGGSGHDVDGAFDGNVRLEIKKTMSLTVDQARTFAVGGSSVESVSGDRTVSVDGAQNASIGKDASLSVEGNQREEAGGKRTMIVGEKLTITCGDSEITIDKNGSIRIKGKDITVQGEGDIRVEGKSIRVKSDNTVDVSASGDVKVKAGNVILN